MLGRIGPPELLVILGLVLVVFGPKKLPEIGRSFGKSLKEFRLATKEIKESVDLGDVDTADTKET
ncbi:MAG: twin-arginine translocase TatA/TatE family subunit [Firmicutes bacterium]|jgi:TatA/E family protein of Tat protein translocase|nr:twin-arginine translocase TatA/TatE family subunit [Bacillota bacterium]MCL5994093.1 twin-arginine translocase TatA/TatE family subunit [Bacillota bacterium]